mmetsp:Transcript_44157/g.116042  ORF Transcript_44157/g.116042 Transcript_44157/m.116042 type:complete len:247 (-) Transcript_44157:249-989(-)
MSSLCAICSIEVHRKVVTSVEPVSNDVAEYAGRNKAFGLIVPGLRRREAKLSAQLMSHDVVRRANPLAYLRRGQLCLNHCRPTRLERFAYERAARWHLLLGLEFGAWTFDEEEVRLVEKRLARLWHFVPIPWFGWSGPRAHLCDLIGTTGKQEVRLRVLFGQRPHEHDAGHGHRLVCLLVANFDAESRPKRRIHCQMAHDEPMHHARLQARLVRPAAARRDPHLVHEPGVHDLGGDVQMRIGDRVE